MRAVVQRVSRAAVEVEGETVGRVGRGFLVLVAAREGDDEAGAVWLARKIAGLRVFEDDAGKMNLALGDIGGGVLAVSQFTLYGDCRKGRRPSFVDAMEPDGALRLYERFVAALRQEGVPTETGRFGEHMAVSLLNDGPVTLIIDTP